MELRTPLQNYQLKVILLVCDDCESYSETVQSLLIAHVLNCRHISANITLDEIQAYVNKFKNRSERRNCVEKLYRISWADFVDKNSHISLDITNFRYMCEVVYKKSIKDFISDKNISYDFTNPDFASSYTFITELANTNLDLDCRSTNELPAQDIQQVTPKPITDEIKHLSEPPSDNLYVHKTSAFQNKFEQIEEE